VATLILYHFHIHSTIFLFVSLSKSSSLLFTLKEESLRGRPGFEHLNDPLHILIVAELPPNVIDIRLRQAQDILEELLKPVV